MAKSKCWASEPQDGRGPRVGHKDHRQEQNSEDSRDRGLRVGQWQARGLRPHRKNARSTPRPLRWREGEWRAGQALKPPASCPHGHGCPQTRLPRRSPAHRPGLTLPAKQPPWGAPFPVSEGTPPPNGPGPAEGCRPRQQTPCLSVKKPASADPAPGHVRLLPSAVMTNSRRVSPAARPRLRQTSPMR